MLKAKEIFLALKEECCGAILGAVELTTSTGHTVWTLIEEVLCANGRSARYRVGPGDPLNRPAGRAIEHDNGYVLGWAKEIQNVTPKQ